jgi:hypothetical protein
VARYVLPPLFRNLPLKAPARGRRGSGRSCPAVGRTRGGPATTLHRAVAGKGRPLARLLTGGAADDARQLRPLPEGIQVPGPGPGRPRTRPDRPQTNGTVERRLRTARSACLDRAVLATEAERALALQRFRRDDNTARPHLALRGLTPLQRLPPAA